MRGYGELGERREFIPSTLCEAYELARTELVLVEISTPTSN